MKDKLKSDRASQLGDKHRIPLSWYVHRLKAMPLREIVGLRLYRAVRNRVIPPSMSNRRPKRLVVSPIPADWSETACRLFPDLVEQTVALAAPLLDHRITLFETEYPLGDPIEWNLDPITGRSWPLVPASRLNYRLASEGDPKDVWELNRHQFLPTLGKAYFLTRDERFASAAISIIRTWIDQCPPGLGIHWTSGIELSMRQISWAWTLRYTAGSEALSSDASEVIASSMFAQTTHVSRNLSLYSSGNNHLISELVAMIVVGHLLCVERWVARGRKLLESYLPNQILSDGVGAEQSPSYQLNTTELGLLAALTLHTRGETLPDNILAPLKRSAQFLAKVLDAEGNPLTIGDSDSARVLPLSHAYPDAKSALNLIASITGREQTVQRDVARDEKCFWLLGPETFESLRQCADRATSRITETAFPIGGYFILEKTVEGRTIKLLFDCGSLGMAPLNAHGHCDALSFILLLDDKSLFIDPGTYRYFGHGPWRDYFRGTSAHNTLRVDGLDQSCFGGRFLTTFAAQSECVEWQHGQKVTGRHLGYRRLENPVTHTRTVEFVEDSLSVQIEDRIESLGNHRIEQFFHADPRWTVEAGAAGQFHLSLDGYQAVVILDDRVEGIVHTGDDHGPLGWVSAVYGRKEPTSTIVGRAQTLEGVTTLITRIEIGLPGPLGSSISSRES